MDDGHEHTDTISIMVNVTVVNESPTPTPIPTVTPTPTPTLPPCRRRWRRRPGPTPTSTPEPTPTPMPEAAPEPTPTPGLSLVSDPGAPQRQLTRREVGRAGLGLSARPVNQDKNVVAASAEAADISATGSPPAQIVPDGNPGLPLSDLGFWLTPGLALLLQPLFLLVRRRREKKKEVQQHCA